MTISGEAIPWEAINLWLRHVYFNVYSFT